MGDKHDAWLAAIGLDVANYLESVVTQLGAAAGALVPAAGGPAPDYSGLHWVARYQKSTDVGDLASGFKDGVTKFIDALKAAGATVTIDATLRKPERAHLMHYAWKIAREGLDPAKAATKVALNGVDIPIEWVHVDDKGKPDRKASKAAAEEMVSTKPDYGMAHQAALNSNHLRGEAIDMTITWSGKIKIKNADGKDVEVEFKSDVDKNTALHKVGKSYGVIKFVSTSEPDRPHWSIDGH